MNWLSTVNVWIGRCVSWLVLALVLTQFAVVVLRYVFDTGSIGLQESVWYMHGLIFMLGAGYTYASNDHVRLDIFYRRFSERGRAWVNLFGCVFLLLPFCAALVWYSLGYVASAWAVREGSPEVSGLPWLWLLKTSLLIFAALLVLQAFIVIARSVLTLRR